MKKQKKCPKGLAPWMASWSDLTTLLLTFFILMVGSDTEGKDFYLILSSFKGSLGMFTGGMTLSEGRLEELGMSVKTLPSVSKGSSLGKRAKKAVAVFQPEIQAKKVRVKEDERGLVISLSGDAYFNPGSAVVKDEIKPVLAKVAKIMAEVPNFVRIEGHTDSSPITRSSKKGYKSNWDLSSARSVNVVKYLVNEEQSNPKQMSAVAFSEYRPIESNDTPEGRAFNRRIDIVILRDKSMTKSKDSRINKPLPDEEWR